MKFLKYFSIFAIAVIIVYLIAFRDNRFQEIRGKVFNTYYTIKIHSPRKSSSLSGKIQHELDLVNQYMSVFEPESEINAINDAPANQTVDLSEEMSKILEKSYRINKMSDGKFDPTIGRLIDLWGFGTKKRQDFPTKEEVKDTLRQVGFNKIQFSDNFTKLQKTNNDVNINLSAIAKGYAVDKIAELLKKEGYKDFIIEIGGEVYASGTKSEEANGWNVGVKSPSDTDNENAAVVTIKNLAVATSGDYRNYFNYNDKRYSHTISPQSGYPVQHNLTSVSVFHKNCMTADGLATAIMAMGEKEGLAFANRNKIAAILFIRTPDDTFQMRASQEAKKLLED